MELPWLESGVGGAGDGSGLGAGLIPVGVVDVLSNNPLSRFCAARNGPANIS